MTKDKATMSWTRTEPEFLFFRVHGEAQRAANAWDAVTFKQMVMAAITALHGVVGAAETVDLLKFSSVSPATASTSPFGSGAVGAEAILRVPAPYASWAAARVRAALSTFTTYEGKPCRFLVLAQAGALVNLAYDSRAVAGDSAIPT